MPEYNLREDGRERTIETRPRGSITFLTPLRSIHRVSEKQVAPGVSRSLKLRVTVQGYLRLAENYLPEARYGYGQSCSRYVGAEP